MEAQSPEDGGGAAGYTVGYLLSVLAITAAIFSPSQLEYLHPAILRPTWNVAIQGMMSATIETTAGSLLNRYPQFFLNTTQMVLSSA